MSFRVGVSGFGLNDTLSVSEKENRSNGFVLGEALLPENPFGLIRVGFEAKEDRVHCGLNWPPESRVSSGQPIRRAPIPVVWRALVEAEDRSVRWNVGHGASFPIARILARHIQGLISGLDVSDRDQVVPVIAIPDDLDEFGQEALLHEMNNLGFAETLLLWRPVAAALAWLDEVEGDFPRRMGGEDHIHVVHLGADAMEFTTLRLRVKEHNGQLYVLPVRDRPTATTPLIGLDWAAGLIEDSFGEMNDGAFWQALVGFPEIWECLAGRAWDRGALPRIWGWGKKWELWSPQEELYERAYSIPSRTSGVLRELLERSCPLGAAQPDSQASFWAEALQARIRRMTEVLPEGRLRGMIVCGPLAPQKAPPWLAAEFEALSNRGLDVGGDLREPQAGRLWLCPESRDPLAEGSAIYGEKAAAGVPSYLDTMPQVSILAQGRGRYEWIPLLNAQEVPGGEEFEDTIRERFQLEGGRRQLKVYLYRGPLKDAPQAQQDPFDAFVLPHEGLSHCQARLVRAAVRQAGSMEKVRRLEFPLGATKEAAYGLAYAKAYYSTGSEHTEEEPQAQEEGAAKTRFRQAVFAFPSAPEKDVRLNVEVRIRPASGLARVELLPLDPAFLQGRKVRLDYATMRPAARLPRGPRGWPGIQEIVVHPRDENLRWVQQLVADFERTPPTARDYIHMATRIRDEVLKKKIRVKYSGQWIYLDTIDQDGQACTEEGNRLVQRVAVKFRKDFAGLAAPSSKSSKVQMSLVTRAAWLYTATPANLVNYTRQILQRDYQGAVWNHAVEAASRVFVEVGDYQLLFGSVAKRAWGDFNGPPTFTNPQARAICRVLMFRKDGEKGLTREIARLFARRALARLKEQKAVGNFSTLFFQLIQLLLYLLRYRRSDPGCFNPDDPATMSAFYSAVEYISEAERHLREAGKRTRADRVGYIANGFEKYMWYEGSEDLITVLSEEAQDDDAHD